MDGIRNQRQRVRGVAENQFRDDERGIERDADGKRAAEIVRRVAVTGMVMGMTMRVGMVVVIVWSCAHC